ncbi:MAG: SDR family oxidoreductase [Burkholderiales bacterium]|nr:SDR family oxidoreductase [Burkholderiales bacterium]
MRIVITGGAGFLGRKLARRILDLGVLTDASGAQRRVEELVLLDVAAADGVDDPRVRTLAGDIADPAVVRAAVGDATDTVFHLAAVVSGEAEQNFDLGWRVNFDATRHLLERCRALARPPKVVFTSSCAVFGGEMPDVVPDTQQLTPQSSYGAQKACGELLVWDYTRKGFVDGRSLRLPTVSVRPGKPNRAASSFASGIVREPLNGVEAICPVAPQTGMWLTSPRTVVDNIVVAHEVPASRFGPTRSINLPGISTSVGAMIEALARVAGADVAARVTMRHDSAIDRIVRTWPARFDTAFARSLGMHADADFDGIVRQYMADELRR